MRQGECLFSMYINAIEDEFCLHGIDSIVADRVKLFYCFTRGIEFNK